MHSSGFKEQPYPPGTHHTGGVKVFLGLSRRVWASFVVQKFLHLCMKKGVPTSSAIFAFKQMFSCILVLAIPIPDYTSVLLLGGGYGLVSLG